MPTRHCNKMNTDSQATSCDKCHKSTEDTSQSLQRCGRCKVAQYCSRDCQTADWSAHKDLCVRPNYLLKFQLCPGNITNPDVVRVLSCPSNATFHDLHSALQLAFSWASTHSFDFRILDPDYEEPEFSIESIQAMFMSGLSADSPRENLLRIVEKGVSGRMALFQVDRMHEKQRKHPRTAEKDSHKTKL